MTDTALAGLRSAIERAGYYPELVADAVDAAVAGEDVEAFVVHQETTFDSEEVRRHITVLVLTTGRLVLGHADDHPADEVTPMPFVGWDGFSVGNLRPVGWVMNASSAMHSRLIGKNGRARFYLKTKMMQREITSPILPPRRVAHRRLGQERDKVLGIIRSQIPPPLKLRRTSPPPAI